MEQSIEVHLGGSGQVTVPSTTTLKASAGMSVSVQGIRGDVTACSGTKLSTHDVARLVNATAGASMDIDCDSVVGDELKFSAGGDLRCYIHDLTSAHVLVRDLGGRWEAHIGQGKTHLTLQSGGNVSLVTDQEVQALPPDYILGRIEKPEPRPAA